MWRACRTPSTRLRCRWSRSTSNCAAQCESAGRDELDPVAPRIGRVEAANARQRRIPLDRHAGRLEPRGERVEVAHREGRVRLGGGPVPLLDSDVELLAAEGKPDAAAAVERLRLRQLPQAEELAEEAARLRLAARRGRNLDVVEGDYFHWSPGR